MQRNLVSENGMKYFDENCTSRTICLSIHNSLRQPYDATVVGKMSLIPNLLQKYLT